MKIHAISIGDYQQIQSLKLNLTYPKGHPKAGQALDRICIIGQSGTGKTTLLRLIKYFITHDPDMGGDYHIDEHQARTVEMEIMIGKHFVRKNRRAAGFFARPLNKKSSWDWDEKFSEYYQQYITDHRPLLLNFPIEAPRRILRRWSEEHSMHKMYAANEFDTYELPDMGPRDYLDFGDHHSQGVWDSVMNRIKRHTSKEIEWKQKIAEAAMKPNRNAQAKVGRLTKEYDEWTRLNPSPLENLAEKLNGLIEPLGVKVKTNVDHQMIMRLGTLQLQTHQGVDLNREFWSTGTRQIIETAVPLIESHANGAVILIDEPEKSLYPDVQSKIIDFYSSLATDCQFFYATHSPHIASCFDPWEIVELKFDETNEYVVQETNYVGDRHVDNYTVYPKYLRWDGILMKLFDLMEDGNSEFRTEALMDAASLEAKLDKMKETGKNKGPEFDRMLAKFIQLKDKLGWE